MCISCVFVLLYVQNEINLFVMAIITQPTKRIKLEHSYSLMEEPVTIKEDPLEYSDIKIEITENNIIKTEPLEDNGDEGTRFEYLNFINTNEIEKNFLSDQCVVGGATEVLNNKSEFEFGSTSNFNSAINSGGDPLQTVKNEFRETDTSLSEDQEKTESRSCSSNNQGSNELGPLATAEKGTESLQAQLSLLKANRSRAKDLQMELGARRMSEICLEQTNTELKVEIQECLKRERANARLIKTLALKLVVAQKENMRRAENTERLRKELTKEIDQIRVQLNKKELELTSKLNIQTLEVAQVKQKYARSERLLKQTVAALKEEVTSVRHSNEELQKEKCALTERLLNQNVAVLKEEVTSVNEDLKKQARLLNQEVAVLKEEVASVRRSNEELQKSLMAEKKVSQLFIKKKGFLDVYNELIKLRESVATLTQDLSQETMECKAQRKAAAEFEKQNLELRRKVQELEPQVRPVGCL